MEEFITNTELESHKHLLINKDIDEILKGEIAAVESYEFIYDKVKTTQEIDILRKIHSEHVEEVEYWRQELIRDALLPQEHSGDIGMLAKSLLSALHIIGLKGSLYVLKQGEDLGLRIYHSKITSPLLNPIQRRHIQEVSIPNQEKHLFKLRQMLSLKE